MRVLGVDETPIMAIRHLSAVGEGRSATRDLPVLRGSVDHLPAELEAVIVASDPQGVSWLAADHDALHLLGEVVAERSFLVISGHVHWSQPLADIRGGAQVLNVDSRVVLLQRRP